MKRQKTTGLAPLGDERLQDLDRRVELRIGRPGQALGLRHEARERSASSKPGAGSTSSASTSSASSSKTCSSSRSGSAARRLRSALARGSRRRADAAHQRQCAPEGEPSPTLVRTRRLQRRRSSSRAPHRGMPGAPGSNRKLRSVVSWRGKARSSPQSRPVMSIRRRCTKWRGEADPRRPRCRARAPRRIRRSSRLSRRSNAPRRRCAASPSAGSVCALVLRPVA